MTQTLRRERRKRFAEIIRKAVYAYYKAYMDETEVERIAAELSDAAESRTEKFTPEDYAAVDKKMDAIVKQEAEAQSRIDSGTGWRGRELLAPEHLVYGDWYHAVTGWQMYGAKAKPKRDSTAMNEFKAWWETQLKELKR